MDVLKLPPIIDNIKASRNPIITELKITELYMSTSKDLHLMIKEKSKQILRGKLQKSNEETKIIQNISNPSLCHKKNKVNDILIDSRGIELLPKININKYSYSPVKKKLFTLAIKSKYQSNQTKEVNHISFNNSVKFKNFIKRCNIGNVFYNILKPVK